MKPEEALRRLAESTAAAMTGVLEVLCPGAATHKPSEVAPNARKALENPPVPGLATSVAYVNGVNGGNVLLLPLEAAQRLAAAMMGGSADDPVQPGDLTDLEQSAIGEAMDQMMSGAAAATSKLLGYEVEIGPPETLPTGTGDLADAFDENAHATTTEFQLCGSPCRFVQLIPQTFVVRICDALAEIAVDPPRIGELDVATRASLHRSIRTTTVRVSAEVGRTRLPVESLVGVPAGTVIELDREADDPIDVYVNGRRFATARLVLTDSGEWAVRIEQVLSAADHVTNGRR